MGCKASKAADAIVGGGSSGKRGAPPGLQKSSKSSFDTTALSPSHKASHSNIKNGVVPSSTTLSNNNNNGNHHHHHASYNKSGSSPSGGGGDRSKSFDSVGAAADKKRAKAAAKAAAANAAAAAADNHDAIYKLLQNAQTLARNAWNCTHSDQQEHEHEQQPVSPMTNTTNTSECWLDEQEQVYTRIIELCEIATGTAATATTLATSTSRTKNNITTSSRMFTFQNGTTGETPLHMAVRLLDYPDHPTTSLVNVIHALIRAHGPAVSMTDYMGNLPIHYAMAPTMTLLVPPSSNNNKNTNNSISSNRSTSGHDGSISLLPASEWRTRSAVVQLLVAANVELSVQYVRRNNVVFKATAASLSSSSTLTTSTTPTTRRGRAYGHAGCTPLYRALQTVTDDFDLHSATVEYIAMLANVCSGANGMVVHDDDDDGDDEDDAEHHGKNYNNSNNNNNRNSMVGVGNAADGDRPLALLYRRFTRQFDLAEKFFDGDNSRREVVEHRRRYKTAAGNTWRIIECLLRPPLDTTTRTSNNNNNNSSSNDNNKQQQHVKEWKIVHRAVQVEAPPDLLRYIVETNAEDLTQPDHLGNLPIHYAAKSKPNNMGMSSPPPSSSVKTSFPAFYTKYVVDELLYKFPEAASMPDAHGRLPFKLAVDSGKQWIGGGIKSLYDAHPAGLEQVNLEEHLTLKKVLQDDLLQLSSAHSTIESPTAAGARRPLQGDDQHQEQATTVTAATTQKSIVSSVGLNTPTSNGGGGGGGGSDIMSSSGVGGGDHDVIPDDQHDAIMLVQHPNVDISEVVCSMWAHEEDAGVQMLSCVAIARMVESILASDEDEDDVNDDILRIALSAVAAVVNAMKAHPNEVIVQEKACHTLALLARTDGQREISFVALGAVGAVVGAMQAHVSDAGAQEEACAAIAEIINHGGADRATIVASVSGLTALVNAIAAHPDAAGVQQQACRALRELTEYPHANLPELPRSQTEPLLLQAKLNFPNQCQEAVDLILSRLSVS